MGAIAALQNIVAFNTEVADELRAVFDDFRTTAYGKGFEVEPIENFNTDEFGASSFAMYNRQGEPEFSLQVEIASDGTVEVYTDRSERQISLSPTVDRTILDDGELNRSSTGAAQVIGAILGIDKSSKFGMSFQRYIGDRLAGRTPQASPSLDFPSREL